MPRLDLLLATALVAAVPLTSSPLSAQIEDRERLLARCERPGWSDDIRHSETRQYGFRPTGVLRADAGRNGGIHVAGWDRDSVHVYACLHVRGWNDAEARETARQIRVTVSENEVRAEGDALSPRAWMVQIVMFVPHRSDVSLTAHNGPLTVQGVSGRLSLDTENGPLALRGVSGDVRGRTRNGPVHVELAGARWEGSGLDVETRNGPVTLLVPDGYSARLETGTARGPMRVNIPMTVREWSGRHIATELGSGGALVRVITTNGPANVRRASDR